MDAVASAALPGRVRRGYALGSVATGTFGTVPGLLLLPYLTDTLGVAAAVAGVVVLVPKAWDVLLNPVAGRISDRSRNPAGRRRPFLLRGGLLLAACFALMFAGPQEPQVLATGWVVVAFLACASAYAFFQVPYVAMPAELTTDYDERTRLMTWRVVVLALAILLSGATAPVVVDAFGDAALGHRVMGLYVGAIIALGALGAWWGTRGAPEHPVPAATGSLREQLRLVARARDFRALLTTFVVQALATATMLAGVAYVADDLLVGDGAAATILFAAFVGPALLVTPLWELLGRRRPKRSGFAAATLAMLAGMLVVAAALPSGPTAVTPWLVYAGTGLVGVGYAGAQVFPLAMLPDAAAHDAATTGENRIGVYTGVWTAGETLGLALGPAVFAAVLAVGGYASSTGSATVLQSDAAHTAIRVGFAVVPAVLVAASLLTLRRYRLDQEVRRD
ncbi:MAG: MFS transporter [Aeromicrobium erythreum]